MGHTRGRGPKVRRLTTLPGIGPITASAYVAALDDAARFGGGAGGKLKRSG